MVHLDYLPGTFFGPSTLVEMVRHRARTQPKDIAFSYLVDGELEQVDLTYEGSTARRGDRGVADVAGAGGRKGLAAVPGRPWISSPGSSGCLYAGVVAVPVIRPAATARWRGSKPSPTTPRPRWPSRPTRCCRTSRA